MMFVTDRFVECVSGMSKPKIPSPAHAKMWKNFFIFASGMELITQLASMDSSEQQSAILNSYSRCLDAIFDQNNENIGISQNILPTWLTKEICLYKAFPSAKKEGVKRSKTPAAMDGKVILKRFRSLQKECAKAVGLFKDLFPEGIFSSPHVEAPLQDLIEQYRYKTRAYIISMRINVTCIITGLSTTRDAPLLRMLTRVAALLAVMEAATARSQVTMARLSTMVRFTSGLS